MSSHVLDLIAPRAGGRLDDAAVRRFDDHVRACAACASALARELRARAALASLAVVPPPAGTLEGVERSLSERTPRRVPARWALLAAASIAAAALLVLVRPGGVAGASFRVDVLAGAPQVGDVAVTAGSVLPVGVELETDMSSSARVHMDIGRVDVGPGSRVAMLDDGLVRRMGLRHGSIRARVLAPPRLFVVETPSATAVDLGCAYAIDVDAAGAGRLVVTSGRVSLERGGREVLVPAGADCALRPGVGPGVPCFRDASPELRAAVALLDSAGVIATPGFHAAVATARPQDTLTLFHALPLVESPLRDSIVARMAQLVPPRDGTHVARSAALDEKALRAWRRQLEKSW